MADITTLDQMYWPLMQLPSVKLPFCAVCGRSAPLEQHHIVWRSWGQLYRDGKRLEKPTITLCGFGSNLSDSDGIVYCHGAAHHRMLHFREHNGFLEYLLVSEPIDYLSALKLKGWRRICIEQFWVC